MLYRARPLVAFIAKRRKNVNATPHSVPLGQRTNSNAVQGCGEIIQTYILNKEPDALHVSASGSLHIGYLFILPKAIKFFIRFYN